jgi:hypothetical protein
LFAFALSITMPVADTAIAIGDLGQRSADEILNPWTPRASAVVHEASHTMWM